MKFPKIALTGTFVISSAFAHKSLPWSPPGPGDVRGPCPMLNTLANHGILPHSGQNLTLNATVKALVDGVNFTPELGAFLFFFALATNPEPNATTFSLPQLGTHGILEHDASLSRADKYFNVSDAFNQEVFDETTAFWTGDLIDLNKAATSRHARAKISVDTNPSFSFSFLARAFAHGEVAALPLVFGDRIAGTAPKNQVISFFETERLPFELGWRKPAVPIGNLDLCLMTQRVLNASGTTLERAEQLIPCSDFNA